MQENHQHMNKLNQMTLKPGLRHQDRKWIGPHSASKTMNTEG